MVKCEDTETLVFCWRDNYYRQPGKQLDSNWGFIVCVPMAHPVLGLISQQNYPMGP